MPPARDLACNPGMCPDWESHQRPFGPWAWTQSTEPHQPGPPFWFGLVRSLACFWVWLCLFRFPLLLSFSLHLGRGNTSEDRLLGCLDWKCPVPSQWNIFIHSFIRSLHSFIPPASVACLPLSGSVLGGQSAVCVLGELRVFCEELKWLLCCGQGCNRGSTLPWGGCAQGKVWEDCGAEAEINWNKPS